jgi:hypothetical protein
MLEFRPERRPTAAAARGGPAGTAARTAVAWRPGHRRAALGAGLAVVVVAVVATVLAVAADRGRGSLATSQTTVPSTVASSTVPTTAPCAPLPYQPCDGETAPFTDGRVCTDDHADYDADARNGCEAAPDDLDGAALDDQLSPNLVPANDVDEFSFDVDDHYHFSCDGTVEITLTAPPGVSLRLQVFDDDGTELGTAVSADGEPGSVRLAEPQCGGDDSTTLTARVSSIGSDRTAASYSLTRSGSY